MLYFLIFCSILTGGSKFINNVIINNQLFLLFNKEEIIGVLGQTSGKVDGIILAFIFVPKFPYNKNNNFILIYSFKNK